MYVSVTDSFDQPIPTAYVEYYTQFGTEVPCMYVDENLHRCVLPDGGDFNIYATDIAHAPYGVRVSSDCEAAPMALDIRTRHALGAT